MITSQYVKKLGKLYFITFEISGVRKQWSGTRDQLEELRYYIDRCLSEQANNQNGHRIPTDRSS